jgi:hypothetical protein
MLKAIVSYSKKIPVPDSQFSSQGYSLSLETEIPDTDPRAIQARLSQTFELVKAEVERELAGANGTAQSPSRPEAPSGEHGPGDAGEKASNKQIKFITDLASRRGIAVSELNARIRKEYGVEGLYDLDRRQASQVVDRLKQSKAA